MKAVQTKELWRWKRCEFLTWKDVSYSRDSIFDDIFQQRFLLWCEFCFQIVITNMNPYFSEVCPWRWARRVSSTSLSLFKVPRVHFFIFQFSHNNIPWLYSVMHTHTVRQCHARCQQRDDKNATQLHYPKILVPAVSDEAKLSVEGNSRVFSAAICEQLNCVF